MLLLGVVMVCFGTGSLLPAHSPFAREVAKLSGGIFEDIFHFPSEMAFRSPYDTMFSSLQTTTPDFHMLAELPAFMSVPHVQVLCSRSQLTLLVDKAYGGVQLGGDDLQLGNGCSVNGELENQFVFTYDIARCDTSRVVSCGPVFQMFSLRESAIFLFIFF